MKHVLFTGFYLLLVAGGYANTNTELILITSKGSKIGVEPEATTSALDVMGGDDDEVVVHPTQYFIMIDPDEHPDTIAHIRELLNSVEIWYRPEINLRLWEVEGFPYTDPQSGNPVTNIQGQVVVAKSKTKINDAGFNVVDTGMTEASDGNEVCFDQIDVTLPQGPLPVKISILDTGIGDLSNYHDPKYTFDLTEYTGYDYIHDDDQPDDEHGHGTGIAGLIYHITASAEGNNHVYFDIRKTHDAEGQGLVSHIIPAILDAVNEGTQIINMSFSYLDFRIDTLFKPLQLAIAYGESHGVLFVAAAGNQGFDNDHNEIISFPASFQNDGILTVASSKCNMDLSSFSSYGATAVDLVIVGEHIPVPSLEFGTYEAHGTSYSCAIASAMAAVMATCHPEFNAAMLKEVFLNSTIYNSNLGDKVLTEGYIDYETTHAFSGGTCEQSSNAYHEPLPLYNTSSISPSVNHGQFTIRFAMETSGYMDVRILDQVGNVVHQTAEFFDAGHHEFYIQLPRIQAAGRMTAICQSPTKLDVLGFVMM